MIVKTGGTVDRVNYQLDKLDTVTDSAVSMADSADTAVRAVSTAISKPVEKVSGVAAGIAHGFSTLRRSERTCGDAMDAAKEAARRREHDLARRPPHRQGTTPMSDERPTPTPTPEPTPKPDPWPQPAPTPEARPGTRSARRAADCDAPDERRRPSRDAG